MTGTFNDALSTLEIWFFDESRMTPGYTSLTHDGKVLSLCTRLHALDLIDYSTPMARRYQILGILRSTSFLSLINWGHLLLMRGDGYF
jgi:hypothetical protein